MKHNNVMLILVLLMVAALVMPVRAESLVGHWEFEGNFNDSSGNDRHGVSVGGATIVYDAARESNVLSLDGLDDYVNITGYKGILGGAARSVCMWINTADAGGTATNGRGLIGWGTDSTADRWDLVVNKEDAGDRTVNSLRINISGGTKVGGTVLTDSTWHHVAAVLLDDGSPNVNEVKLYVDGVEDVYSSSIGRAVTTISGIDVRIGLGVKTSIMPYYGGLIDDVRIYDHALTLTEIMSLADVETPESALVSEGPDGKLVYTYFANPPQTNEDNILPDWSHAGYMGGGVALPAPGEISIKVTLNPDADNDDDGPRIQAAIDQVEALPLNGKYRGAILLKEGYYEVENTLTITESGVVLRGEGQGLDGTIVEATRPEKYTLLEFGTDGGEIVKDPSVESDITSDYVGIGANQFDVASTSGFSVGDLIVVIYTRNEQWITDLGVDEGDSPWTTGGYQTWHARTITGISGNTISIDIRLVDVIQVLYGGGKIQKASYPSGYIQNSGIENIRLSAIWDGVNDDDENHANIGIICRRMMNCWIRGVTLPHFITGIRMRDSSSFNTIQDCAVIDHKSIITGGKRYSFSLDGGTGNLIQRCYVRDTRHAFVTNASRVRGPNVFLDCYSTINRSAAGPHQRWVTGDLYDNVDATMFEVTGSYWGGHGWKGAQCMMWNIVADRNEYAGGGETVDATSPPGYRNWCIGAVPVAKSTGRTMRPIGDGYWEHWRRHVTPRSLYLKQLEDRLGSSAVENITIPEQRVGTIWDKLAAWAGEGSLVNNGDINKDGRVDMPDFAILASRWLDPCSKPDWCSGADVNRSGLVDMADLRIVAENWLEGTSTGGST